MTRSLLPRDFVVTANSLFVMLDSWQDLDATLNHASPLAKISLGECTRPLNIFLTDLEDHRFSPS